jgi:hypothetical protein
VSVDHGGLDIGVAHQLLHRGQVNAAHDQVAGEGVAECVDTPRETPKGIIT